MHSKFESRDIEEEYFILFRRVSTEPEWTAQWSSEEPDSMVE